ncbi:triose-phosphate isomerase [Candidatus Falkowbacteria bacterium]|nr:triose-phosphate isomerase [Candidatus Falkowbacteria bacterium]
MRRILIANWKMNLNHQTQTQLAEDFKKRLKKIKQLEIVVAPSFVHLQEVSEIFNGTNIKLAAQDVAFEKSGAFTGEVSAGEVREIGCQYAIIGHSERRIKLNETEKMVSGKINQCYGAGMIPILCVGETSEERMRNETESVIIKQLYDSIYKVSGLPEKEIIIAYEPVWAVGGSQFLDPDELAPIAFLVKKTLSAMYSEKFYNNNVRFIYGGSVNSIIAPAFWSAKFLDGLLIGAASLDIEEFYNIASEGETFSARGQ